MKKVILDNLFPKKAAPEHMKEIEKEMLEHKNFFDGEVKLLTELKGTFQNLKKIESQMQHDANESSGSAQKHSVHDKLGNVQQMKDELESKR